MLIFGNTFCNLFFLLFSGPFCLAISEPTDLDLTLSPLLLNAFLLYVHHIVTEPAPIVLQPHHASLVYHGVIHCKMILGILLQLLMMSLSPLLQLLPDHLMAGEREKFLPGSSGVIAWWRIRLELTLTMFGVR